MFHLLGFSESQDSAVLVPTAALQDQAIQVSGDQIIVPNDLRQIIFYGAMGPDLTRAQLVSPSLRRNFNEEIYPLSLAAQFPDQTLVTDKSQSPLILDAGEPLEAWMAEGNAAASRGTIIAAIADSPPMPQSGDFHTIRVTASFTAVASAWTNGTLTFNDVLPSGMWGVVGAMFNSATMQAFRLVFKGQGYRPGFFGATTIGQRHHRLSRNGGMGLWGTFENLTPPSIDVLCTAGDTAVAGVLDLVLLQAYR